MSKKRHNKGGNIRCPHCNGTMPLMMFREYYIKSNYLRRTYRCSKCHKQFATIEIQTTQKDTIKRLAKKHKPATSYTILYDLYYNDFNKFLEQYIQTDEFNNFEDFIVKISKISGRIDKFIYLISDKLLPEDTDIIYFKDQFLKKETK